MKIYKNISKICKEKDGILYCPFCKNIIKVDVDARTANYKCYANNCKYYFSIYKNDLKEEYHGMEFSFINFDKIYDIDYDADSRILIVYTLQNNTHTKNMFYDIDISNFDYFDYEQLIQKIKSILLFK